jgi:hypothetical protein
MVPASTGGSLEEPPLAPEGRVGLSPPRLRSPEADAALQFIVRFLPVERRTIQRDGLTFMRLRYRHPIFAAWREQRRPVLVRYHPDDLSRRRDRPCRG